MGPLAGQRGGVSRTTALALVALGLWGLGLGARLRGPARTPALGCEPGRVRLMDGVARCGEGQPLSAAQRLLLGQPLDLNRVSEAELARVPGVGAVLARQLVRAREAHGGFVSWTQVASVPGVGPARLRTLRAAVQLR